jgi:hypothetical protein
MKSPLILDLTDDKWLLFESVIKNLNNRRISQEISKVGIKPLGFARTYLSIIFMAMFFCEDITYIVQEVTKRPELRRFLNIRAVPTAARIYRFSSQFSEDQFVTLTWRILNTLCAHRSLNQERTLIIDGTSLSIDLNWFRKKYTKSNLDSLPYSWGYSPSKGYYIGYKLTLVVDEQSLIPLAFLLHPGSPGDTKIFTEIIEELARRHIIRDGDTLLWDRGYYSYNNYIEPLIRYRVLPLILPKRNLNINKLKNMLNFPLTWFYSTKGMDYRKKTQNLVEKLMRFLSEPEEWIFIRSKIEDVFKFGKKALSWEHLHCYTQKSVKKNVVLNVLLLGLVLLADSSLKQSLKRAAEW